MAKKDLDFSGLDELYSEPSSSEGQNLSGLDDIYSQPSKSEPQISGLTAAELGVRHLGGAGPIVAGAAQAIPDWLTRLTSGDTPNLEGKSPSEIQQALKGKSPTQVDAALKSLGIRGDIGPTTSKELYKEAKEEQEAPLHLAEKQHPFLTGAGKLAGDVLAWEGIGAFAPKIKLAEDAGRLQKVGAHVANAFIPGAAIGAMESKHDIVGGSPSDALGVAKDAAKSGATASLLVGGLSALAEGTGALSEAVAESKTGKKIKGYYDIGKEGKDLSKESAQIGGLNAPELADPISLHDTKAASEVLNSINTIDTYLGERVGQTIDDGTKQGIRVLADQDAVKKIDDVFNTGRANEALEGETPDILDEDQFDNTKLKKFFDLANRFKNDGLNPSELQEFRNGLGDMQRRIYYTDQPLAMDISALVKKLTEDLKNSVPGYKTAAERLAEFRKQIPETILSKDNPSDITRLRMAGIRNVNTKMVNQLKSMIRGLNDPNNVTARGSFTNLLQGLQKFHTQELMGQAEGKQLQTAFEASGISPQLIEDQIKKSAMKSKLLQDYTGLEEFDLLKAVKQPVTELVVKPASYIANKLGKMRSGENTLVNTAKKLYNASDEELEVLANKLERTSQKHMGKALRTAIEKKNEASKNAILFQLMQNPDSRRIIQSGELYVGAGE